MLESRTVEDLHPTCPAAYAVGETISGSGVLCRISGNLVTTGRDPASLRAFCCNRLPMQTAVTSSGEKVSHGYQACPLWLHNRRIELEEGDDLPADAPQRVRDAYRPEFITRA